jgi:hypothetical protein
MSRRSVLSFVVLCLLTQPILAQAPVRVGVEFQVPMVTFAKQGLSSIGLESNGDFVVVWADEFEDGSMFGVFAQRFASSGARLGSDFQVNSYTFGVQTYPAVALDADGDFVVTWTSSFDQDGDDMGVFARRFSSSGLAQGSELAVNAFTIETQHRSVVARAADGDFVIAWTSYGQDGSGDGVFARRFNSSGVAQGGEFQVNLHTASFQGDPAIDVHPTGSFVITWESSGQDGSSNGVFGQRFNALGAPQGAEFQANTYETGSQTAPDVGLEANGDFVVAWTSFGQDGSGGGVFARRFDSSGAPLRGETQVNLYVTGSQYDAELAVDASGDFVVVWTSSGQDGDETGIFARHFRASGVPTTTDLPVNSTKTGNQFSAAVRSDVDGDFAVVWTSYPQDGSSHGVFGQRFDVPPLLDIDGNGELTALTDGLLVLRFLFGFTGTPLTSGAVGPGCTRCDATAILPYLQSLT